MCVTRRRCSLFRSIHFGAIELATCRRQDEQERATTVSLCPNGELFLNCSARIFETLMLVFTPAISIYIVYFLSVFFLSILLASCGLVVDGGGILRLESGSNALRHAKVLAFGRWTLLAA